MEKDREEWLRPVTDLAEILDEFRKTALADELDNTLTKIAKEKGWPKKLKKGRFTSYCKSNGFDGPCKECAEKALKSDDASVRGMGSFYLNTVKP